MLFGLAMLAKFIWVSNNEASSFRLLRVVIPFSSKGDFITLGQWLGFLRIETLIVYITTIGLA